MAATGVNRPLDGLGRVTIPMEIRKNLSIPEGTRLDIRVEGNKIILEKTNATCAICGSDVDVMEIGEKGICQHCIGFVKENL